MGVLAFLIAVTRIADINNVWCQLTDLDGSSHVSSCELGRSSKHWEWEWAGQYIALRDTISFSEAPPPKVPIMFQNRTTGLDRVFKT